MFAFIREYRDRWPIVRLCRILQVSMRGYRAYVSGPMCERQRTDLKVLAHIDVAGDVATRYDKLTSTVLAAVQFVSAIRVLN